MFFQYTSSNLNKFFAINFIQIVIHTQMYYIIVKWFCGFSNTYISWKGPFVYFIYIIFLNRIKNEKN